MAFAGGGGGGGRNFSKTAHIPLGKENMELVCPGAVVGVEDWSDYLRKTSTRQLLVRQTFKNIRLTTNGKILVQPKSEWSDRFRRPCSV